MRRGVVRRAKLYYLRNLTGKAARIREKRNVHKRLPLAAFLLLRLDMNSSISLFYEFKLL